MADISRILALLKVMVFGIDILLALIYSLLILLNRRFHHRLNILTVNICLSMICASTYYMVYFILWEYDIEDLFTEITCTFLFYIQTICTCQTPFSLTMLTINQFCAIKYPGKEFFKSKLFVALCIASQWTIVCVISLPFQFNIQPYCNLPYWLSIYTVVIAVVVPTLITLIINLLIFKHVHSSSRRVQAQHEGTVTGANIGQRLKINRRDMSLLKHTIFMLAIFIIGWGPIFLLIAIDYAGNVIPLIYTILQILAVVSSFSCMLDLFLYNRELRQYMKNIFLQYF